ncbi:MAG: AAA family ATPase [Candidatus Microthrix sp.]|nr:AAA family ATPase [Candidatus Microthrix sp.]
MSNSKFLGPLTIDFNQQYNAVIGGRGTGKSTILSYLRWGLCDQPADHDQTSSEAGSIGARQRRLIEATLFPLDAQVEVHFVINGIPHVVRRQADTGNIRLKIGGADFVPARGRRQGAASHPRLQPEAAEFGRSASR